MAMSRRLRTKLFALLIAAALWPLAASAELPPGAALPSGLGIDSDKKPVSVEAFRGKVLVVTFWASWCGPCMNELPIIENLQRSVDDQLVVVAVNIESPRKFRDVRRALHRADLELTLTNDADGSAKTAWGVGPIPQMYIIDHEGQLAHQHRGYDERQLPRFVDEINALLLRRHAALTTSDS